MGTVACKATGKQFSSTVLRYLCSWSLDVFCEAAVQQIMVYESPDATEKEKPVTWCTEVKNTIQEAEHQLNHSLHLNQLADITAALQLAEDKPVEDSQAVIIGGDTNPIGITGQPIRSWRRIETCASSFEAEFSRWI